VRRSPRWRRLLPPEGLARVLWTEAVRAVGDVEGYHAVCLGLRAAAHAQVVLCGMTPSVVLRLDSWVPGGGGPPGAAVLPVGASWQEALRLDAAAVLLTLPWVSARAEVLRRAGEWLARTAARCRSVELPVLARVLVLRASGSMGYRVAGTATEVEQLVGWAGDLGADGFVVDAGPETWAAACRAAGGRPVFGVVRGGARGAELAGAAGLAGVVVWEPSDPAFPAARVLQAHEAFWERHQEALAQEVGDGETQSPDPQDGDGHAEGESSGSVGLRQL
jgi:hypothetical protein